MWVDAEHYPLSQSFVFGFLFFFAEVLAFAKGVEACPSSAPSWSPAVLLLLLLLRLRLTFAFGRDDVTAASSASFTSLSSIAGGGGSNLCFFAGPGPASSSSYAQSRRNARHFFDDSVTEGDGSEAVWGFC